ncbi:MAG: 50S ribosomal protein L32e [Thermoplasmata archaeon]|nr:50S ribosomal protein L32e [Thermoplasmata archaeon]
MALRDEQDSKRPAFRRQEWHRYVRLGTKWRKPQGMHSKLRRKYRWREKRPIVGYRSVKMARGLHPSGFEDILVHRPADLEGLDPKVQAARIGHSVGVRKRIAIIDKADKLGIRVLNRGEE